MVAVFDVLALFQIGKIYRLLATFVTTVVGDVEAIGNTDMLLVLADV